MRFRLIFIALLIICFLQTIPAHSESSEILSIPHGTTAIDNSLLSSFPENQRFSSVYIPETVTSINFDVFQKAYFSTVESYCVSELNPCYQSVDGAIYSKDGKYYYMYPRGRETASYVISQGVETIGKFAFFEADIDCVYFPDSLVAIEDCAFFYSEIMYARFNDGLSAIGDFAFMCCNLEGVSLPSTLKYIGCEAFSGCSLDYVEIPEGVLEIGGGAFAYNQLSVLLLPSTLDVIGYDIIGWNHMEDEDYFTTVIVTSGTLADQYASVYLSDYNIRRIDKQILNDETSLNETL